MISSAPAFSTNFAESPMPKTLLLIITTHARNEGIGPAPAPKIALPDAMVSRKRASASFLLVGRGMSPVRTTSIHRSNENRIQDVPLVVSPIYVLAGWWSTMELRIMYFDVTACNFRAMTKLYLVTPLPWRVFMTVTLLTFSPFLLHLCL